MSLVPVDETTLISERARLVRLCYRLTGNLDAAEDLAQETLYEAIRNVHKLRDPSGHSRWLSSIAYNVCLRWNSARGRDIRQLAEVEPDWDPPDDYDLDIELERSELVDLLDRAMAMLAPESRDVLVERYVNDSPHSEIAKRLGLTGVAVRKRLERGKLRLKRVLSTVLVEDSVSLGLSDSLFADWSKTGIWCPACGKRHLLGRFTPDGALWLICKPCLRLPAFLIFQGGHAEMFRGVKGYKSALSRMLVEQPHRTCGGIADWSLNCRDCGGMMRYRRELHPRIPIYYAIAVCERCGSRRDGFVTGYLVLSSAEGRRFWQENPKIRSLPMRYTTVHGVPAEVVGYESVTGNDRIEGVFVQETFERIAIYRNGGPA